LGTPGGRPAAIASRPVIRSRGKRVYIVSSEHTLSREPRMVADQPVFYIEDYQDRFERDPS